MLFAVTPALLKQLLLTLAVSLAYLGIGLVRGYSAPAIPSIRLLAPHLAPTKEAESWASAIPPLGAMFGSLLAGPLMQRLGRRRTLMLASPLWGAAWVIIACSSQPWMLLTGRILTGGCVGIVLPAAQVYVSECCDPGIRGMLGSLPALFMSGGILLTYIMGTWLAWDTLAWCASGIVCVIFFAVLPLPESPVWLAGRDKIAKSEKSSKWLHLPPATSEMEMKIRNQTEGAKDPNHVDSGVSSQDNPFSKKILMSRQVLQPLGIGLTILTLQQFSGIDAVIFFTVDIFHTSGSSLNDNLATIIVGAVQLISNGASLLVIDRAGRKPLLMVSGAIMSVAMAAMGTAFYLHERGNESLGALPLASLITFMIGFSLGYGCIPFLLIGELFPVEQRSALSAVAGSFNLGAMFLVIKSYHYLQELLTAAGTFWLYSCLCAGSILFVIFCVPETKGRSLDEIQMYFRREKVPDTTPIEVKEPTIKQLVNDALVEQENPKTRL